MPLQKNGINTGWITLYTLINTPREIYDRIHS